MTREKLIEIVKKRLGGGHYEMLAMNIGMAFNQINYETFRKDLSALDLYTKEFLDVDVDYNTINNYYYSTLPEEIVQLPDTQAGVRRIMHSCENTLIFVPIKKDAKSIFDLLEVGQVDLAIGYSVESTQVIYDRKPQGIDKVRMDLVIPFDKYDDDDVIFIPSGKDELLIETIVNLLQGQPKENKVNINA